jgi:hypothetical protein
MPKETHGTELVELSLGRRKRQKYVAHFGKMEDGKG